MKVINYKLVLFFISLVFTINIISAQYSNCAIYGNCVPSKTGTTNINNSYTNVTYVNGSSYNSTYNNLLNQDCPANYVINGTYTNGTFKCTSITNGSSLNASQVSVINNASNTLNKFCASGYVQNGVYPNGSIRCETNYNYWDISNDGGPYFLWQIFPSNSPYPNIGRLRIGDKVLSSDTIKYVGEFNDKYGNGFMNRLENNEFLGASYWFSSKDDSFHINPYALKLYQRGYSEMTASYGGSIGQANPMIFSVRKYDDSLGVIRTGSESVGKDENPTSTLDVAGTGRFSNNLEVGSTDYSYPSVLWDKSPDRVETCTGTLSACSSMNDNPPCTNISGCEWGNCDGTLDCSTYNTEETCLAKPLICNATYSAGVCTGDADCENQNEANCLDAEYYGICQVITDGGSCSDNPSLDCSTMNEAECSSYSAGCQTNNNFNSCSYNGFCDTWDNTDQTTCEANSNCLWDSISDCYPSVDCSVQTENDCTTTYDNICDAGYVFSSCSTTGTCSSFNYGGCPTSFGCVGNAPIFQNCADLNGCVVDTSCTFTGCSLTGGTFQSCDNIGACSDLTSYGSTTCGDYYDCSWGTSNPSCVGSILDTNCEQIAYADCSPDSTSTECNQLIANDTVTHIDQTGIGQTENAYICRDSNGNNVTTIDSSCGVFTTNDIIANSISLSGNITANNICYTNGTGCISLDWTHNFTSHVLYTTDGFDKVCIGTASQCTNPSHLLLVNGGINVTGNSIFNGVASTNILNKIMIITNLNVTNVTNLYTLSVGNSTDNFTIDNKGRLRLFGTAQQWDDVSTSLVAGTRAGSKTPTFDEVTGGWWFNDQAIAINEEYVFGALEFPHNGANGTNFSCHLHIATTGTAGGVATFELNYTWTNINDIYSSNRKVAYMNITLPTTYQNHSIVEFAPDFDGRNKTLSSIMKFKLTRRSSYTSDTATQPVEVDSFGCHYLHDSLGSNQEFIKY